MDLLVESSPEEEKKIWILFLGNNLQKRVRSRSLQKRVSRQDDDQAPTVLRDLLEDNPPRSVPPQYCHLAVRWTLYPLRLSPKPPLAEVVCKVRGP